MVDAFNSEQMEPKGPSVAVQAIIFVVLTAVAAGVGFGGGQFLFRDKVDAMSETATVSDAGTFHKSSVPAGHDAEKEGHAPEDGENGSEQTDLSGKAIELETIVTNILAPKDIWLRIELAIVAKEPIDEILKQEIHQDFLTYIRTLQLTELEGPSAFLDFKANLLDRARIRSEGKVENVFIKTLLYE